MKSILIGLILCCPALASAQVFINPEKTQQPGDIYIQNTDVYYHPMAPPDSNDWRGYLSTLSARLRDSNGIDENYNITQPYTHGMLLRNWQPPGDSAPLGEFAIWQRFFTARRKWDGTPSNIVAGSRVTDSIADGPVIISKNEDVDFRASGRIKLKSGFHAKPGCRFHAYIEPKWGAQVFGDEFDSTAVNRSIWYVENGSGDDYGSIGANCAFDSNARTVHDPDAHDSMALDIILHEYGDSTHIDSCGCPKLGYQENDNCDGSYPSHPTSADTMHFAFSTAMLRSCPWPYTSAGTPVGPPVYQNAPYGKYEIRDKIPHTSAYNNTFGGGNGFEWDLNETSDPGYMVNFRPGIGLQFRYGPFKGIFGSRSGTDTTRVFRSSQPQWSYTNQPGQIFIDSFVYGVAFAISGSDTCLVPNGHTFWSGGFPYSVGHSPDSVTFFYSRSADNKTEPIPWTVTQDSTHKWKIFSAPYRISGSDTFRFSKAYQPTKITLGIDHAGNQKTLNCFWDSSLNYPVDRGLIYLNDTELDSSDLHINTEPYQYSVTEGSYPMPIVRSPVETGARDTVYPYVYHTYSMEVLPNEIRYLMDSNVIWRIPDRMVPRGNPYFNYASRLMRTGVNVHPCTFALHLASSDPLGIDSGSITYYERKYFEEHDTETAKGFWPVTIGSTTYPAAHHLVDYVKIWDAPADIKIADFPH